MNPESNEKNIRQEQGIKAQEESGYTKFLKRAKELIFKNSELEGLRKWFEERVGALPEMKVAKTQLTGKGGWAHEMSTDGKEVNKIKSGFFNVEGYDIELIKADGTTLFAWNQAGIAQSEEPISMPTPEGEIEMDVSGFVGIIRDTAGNVLLTVGQEPLAGMEKKALVRTPFQTSTKKLQGLLEGKKELDPALAAALEAIGGGKTPFEMFESGQVEIFPLALADGNRIQATNIGFVTTVQDEKVRDKLSAEGKNRWCSPKEVKALVKAGLVNGHTASALQAVS